MGFADLFKSTKEREREARLAMRSVERDAERRIDRIGDRIKELEKEQAKIWADAKAMLQAGKKLDAQRLKKRHDRLEILINRQERQQMFYRGRLNAIMTASDANEATKALAELSKTLRIDPGEIDKNLMQIEDVDDDIKEVNSVLDKAYEKDDEKIAAESEKLNEGLNDEDEKWAALESEAAAEIGGGSLANASKSEDDINAGRDRLRALLDEK